MKLKRGDCVTITTGTPSSSFQGSLLDRNPFKKSVFEYDAVGKILEITKTNIAIDIWQHGAENLRIANVSPEDTHFLQPTDKILTYDYKLGVYQVFNPECLPQDGSREYYIEASHYEGDSGQTSTWTIWALNRKEAFKKLKRYCQEFYKTDGVEKRAWLKWRNQTPFRALTYLK